MEKIICYEFGRRTLSKKQRFGHGFRQNNQVHCEEIPTPFQRNRLGIRDKNRKRRLDGVELELALHRTFYVTMQILRVNFFYLFCKIWLIFLF